MEETLKLGGKRLLYLEETNDQTFGRPVAVTSAVKRDTEAAWTLAVASPTNVGLLTS